MDHLGGNYVVRGKAVVSINGGGLVTLMHGLETPTADRIREFDQ